MKNKLFFQYRHPSFKDNADPRLFVNWDGSLDLMRKYLAGTMSEEIFIKKRNLMQRKAINKYFKSGQLTLDEYNDSIKILNQGDLI